MKNRIILALAIIAVVLVMISLQGGQFIAYGGIGPHGLR